jgi:DNA-directed RNA polymerase subunit F
MDKIEKLSFEAFSKLHEELIGNEWKQVTVKDKLSLEDLAKVADVLGRNLETITVILKTNIKKAIEDGNQIEGASIVEKFGLTLK